MIPVNPAPADEIRRHIEDFRNCFSRLPMACFAVGTDGHVYFANTPAAELLGYSVEELTTHSVFDLYADTPTGKLKASRLFTRFEHGKEIRHAELHMQKKEGTLVPVCLCAYPVLAADGSTVASQSFVTDLTDLTQRHEHRIHRLLMQSTDAVFVIDPDDERILAANRRACTMLGYEINPF
ncbi:MAG: PAS domain-containing protein [Bacteroidales bacterium]